MTRFARRRHRVGLWVLAATFATVPGAHAYEGTGVTDGGTITGRVRVVGDVAPLPPQPVHKEMATCGHTVRDDRLVVGDGGALEFAVVRVKGIAKGKPVPSTDLVLHNRICAFVPHVMSATIGQTLQIVNDDPILHDAHAWLGQRTLFNLAIPRGRTVHHRLDDAGLVHINCNVRHTWMHAYVLVADDPYHAVTGPEGQFTITDVPAGNYRLTTWHEMLGTIETPVTVIAGETVTTHVNLSSVAAYPTEGNQ
jgi:plastocyanin